MALRDLALTLLLIGALPVSVARPFVGVVLFAWISLMNPHRLTWGFAYGFAWAQFVAIATLAGFLATKDREIGDSLRRYRVALLYVAWTALSTAFAFSFDAAFPKFVEFVKVQLMCLITLCLLTTRRRVEIFVAVAVGSVAFFGIKGGVFTLITGGAHRVFGPSGSVLADNNQLATALVMTVPLLYWLAHWVKSRWQRLALYGCMGFTAISIFGSHSRGALIAIAVMGLFLVMKSDRKALTLIFVVLAGTVGILFMPDEYWQRMESITEYQEDQSAQGRLEMWRAAVAVASENLTGGGFDMYRAPQFLAYIRTIPRSAHSIYFQALGEHGWVGLALMVAFWIGIWIQCRRALSELARLPDARNLTLLVRMTQVSLVGFASGGTFVNIGYWDFPFYLALGVLAIRRLVATGRLAAVEAGPDARAGTGRPQATGARGQVLAPAARRITP